MYAPVIERIHLSICRSPLAWYQSTTAIKSAICAATFLASASLINDACAAPKVVLVSLDGATPRLLKKYLNDGTLTTRAGLGWLQKQGVRAAQNVTVSPSLTAPGHIAIATGSIAAKNDIVANTFHLVASPFANNVSGFGAPIGGYNYANHTAEEAAEPTAEPLWLALRAKGKTVVTATFPGGDGVDVRVPGLNPSPVIQSAAKRTVDFTVPFGAFGGAGARGFDLKAADFSAAPPATLEQMQAAGVSSYSPVLQTSTALETLTIGGKSFTLQLAALDSTDDSQVNYDTLLVFDQSGIPAGPFALPATGPAFVRLRQTSALYYFEGSSNRAGTAFFLSALNPDLSTVHLTRYAANFIPRNAPVLADVDDINANVGFWAPQADFRIPERLSPGFGTFSDQELEAIYEDQVRTFVDYQSRLAARAVALKPDADLVMIYIEQPDGSSHQFLINDQRQATNPVDANSIGANQDSDKIRRYRRYLAAAYKVADRAVQKIVDTVGTDRHGLPKSNIFVVSDHGFAPFHTAVDMNAFLASQGFDTANVRAITSGPTVNLYINLKGREPNGTVERADYVALQQRLVSALKGLQDTNPTYKLGKNGVVFDQIHRRPVSVDPSDPDFGLQTSKFIGQDSGDVYALLSLGYNFDGTQSPPVRRLDDDSSASFFSVPNFYGAHGYNPLLRDMSAIFIAAGPNIRRGELNRVRNIDVAPTILSLLGVKPGPTVDGRILPILRKE